MAVVPNHAETLHTAARAFAARDWVQTETLCRQVLQAKPRQADALHLLALVLSETGRADDAIGYLREAIDQQPASAVLWTNLGTIHRDRGQFADAVDCYRRATALKDDFPEAQFNLGLALRRADNSQRQSPPCVRQRSCVRTMQRPTTI